MGLDKRLLVIADIGVGPPHHGNRSRMKAVLTALRDLGYEIHFAGVKMDPTEREATRPHVDKWVADFEVPQRLSHFPVRIQTQITRLANALAPRFMRRLGASAGEVDHWFHPTWLPQARALQERERYPRVVVHYVFHSAFLKAFPSQTRKVLDTHDVFANRDLRLADAGLPVDHGWISMSPEAEAEGLNRADVVIGIQDHESDYFRSIVGEHCAVHTIGHIPESYFLPFPEESDAMVGYVAGANRINVTGFAKFASEVWPLVLEKSPGLRLGVAGGICEAIERLPPNSLMLGTLEDVKSLYRRCAVMINPTFAGTGLKIKSVESLAFGRPCVTTRHAAEGLEAFVGHGLLIADSNESFADIVVELCRDCTLAEKHGKAAINRFMTWKQRSIQELQLAIGLP